LLTQKSPTHKGKIHTLYGFFLSTQFAAIVVGIFSLLKRKFFNNMAGETYQVPILSDSEV